jgi:hypothetical protein
VRSKAHPRGAPDLTRGIRCATSRLPSLRGLCATSVPQPGTLAPGEDSPGGRKPPLTCENAGAPARIRTWDPRIKGRRIAATVVSTCDYVLTAAPTSPTNRPQLTSFHATNHATPTACRPGRLKAHIDRALGPAGNRRRV